MKLLVTGGCGFIGSAFCRKIKKNHHYLTLVNIDYLYPCSTIADDLITSCDNYHFIKGDIKDRKLLDEILEKYNIDTVIHFAAQSHVDTSFTNPLQYTYDNIIGTHILLEACKKWGNIKKFVQISTDEVYGENILHDRAFTETSLMKPTNPYAASKASAELMVHSYIHSYNLPAIIIRSNNVYGPGQYPEKVLPKFILQILDNKKITIQGSGHQLRSFLYVEDAVDAILCVMFQGKIGEIYNINSEDEMSILDLAKKVLFKIRPDNKLEDSITFIEDRNFNDKRYWIEAELLKALGWKQQWKFDDGLDNTINWFKSINREKYWSDNRKVVLCWGLNGWIGGLMKKYLENDNWSVINSDVRVNNRNEIVNEVKKYNPTHILCLIGRTHGQGYSTIDYLEQKGKLVENLNDNLYGPFILASVAKEYNIHMTYFGTGCIFEYDEEHPLKGKGFDENDLPNFFGSSYSVVKGFTDRIMHDEFDKSVLNIRIRMPISSEDGPRNFITKIINYEKICSIPNSMSVLDDIFPILIDCMNKKNVGTLNAVNPGAIDHNTILNLYKTLQNPEHEWTEISKEELINNCVKSNRSNNYLKTNKIESICPDILSIEKSVERILKNYKFEKKLSNHS